MNLKAKRSRRTHNPFSINFLRGRVWLASLLVVAVTLHQFLGNVSAQGLEWVPGESPFQRQIVSYDETVTPYGTFREYDLAHPKYEEFEAGGWDGEEGKSMLGFELSIGPETKHAPFISSDYYIVTPLGGPTAIYELANQASYTVPLGSVKFEFKGARIRMTETLPSDSSCSPTTQQIDGYSGWATEIVSRADSSIDQRMSLVKGYLTQHVILAGTAGFVSCDTEGEENPPRRCNANYVYRFSYHPPGGGRVMDFYQKPVEQLVLSRYNGSNPFNVCASYEIGNMPSRYWSTDGSAWLDMRDETKPVIVYSDGSREELAPAVPTDFPGAGAMGCLAAPAHLSPGGGSSGPLRTIDKNGNMSTYTISANGMTETVTDSRGRQTILTFSSGTSFKRLMNVKLPAPAGNPAGFLQYNVNWQTLNLNMASAFPDITCHVFGNCGSATVDVVSSIQIPDGRSYFFQYGPFGNLTQVTDPGGVVRVYAYGGQTNTAYAANSVPLTTRPLRVADGTAAGCPIWTGQAVNLQKRGVISETVFPQGTGNPGHATTTSYERVVLPGTPVDVAGASTTETSAGDQVICNSQVWRVVTMPDGSVHKQGYCTNALQQVLRFSSGFMSSHEWELGTETWSPGQSALLSASYKGNKNTGALFYDKESITAHSVLSAPAVDKRVARVVSFKEGIVSATTFTYGDVIDIDHGSSVVNRNTTNVTSQSAWSCSDLNACLNGQFVSRLVQTDTTYFHPPPYFDPAERNPSALSRNILHLVQHVTLTDPARGVLTRTDFRYDEFALTPSAAPNLMTDPSIIGAARGNPTTTIAYKSPATAAGPVPTEVRYFDTGDVRQTFDPLRRNPTTKTYDFSLCSPTHTRFTNTVTNVKGFVVTTVADCFTGAVLRETDANNQSMFKQYDTLGRVVETAGPGDTLTPISGFTRDPSAPTNGGTVVGHNGQGPTSWTEYVSLGVLNQQRTVVHTKDGTSNGLYVKTFVDGLGREIQTRKEVDPATSGGNAETVSTTVYDGMGRVSSTSVLCFSPASNSVTSSCTTLATTTTYDALGRVTSVRPPGLPPTIMSYGRSGSLFLTTSIDANGNQTQSYSDVLGRTVQVARQSSTCSDPVLGNWCVTVMAYDAVGRLLQTTDPGQNRITFNYDGLNRKTSMTDPNMGAWSYIHDDNGNLIQQTDAKGQIIVLSYDVLNRVTRKDLPPTGAGAEDATYFYDGETP